MALWSWLMGGCVIGISACSLLYDTSDFNIQPQSMDAAIADVSIADVAEADVSPPLDATVDGEVTATGRVTDGLVAFFGFDEDGGTAVHDTADGGDHLTLELRAAPRPDGDGGLRDAAGPADISWAPGKLTVSGPAIGESTAPANAIRTRCSASGQVTVEAWVRTSTLEKYGPARIVTMSLTGGPRNFTLAQEGPDLVFRVRSSSTNYEELRRPAVFKVGALTHLVATARADGQVNLYVDGVQTTALAPTVTFEFASYRLAIANEIDGFLVERGWRGDLHLVAIYDRTLSTTEVLRNLEAGADP